MLYPESVVPLAMFCLKVGDLGVVGLVFNLPSHHRVHHGANRFLRGFYQHVKI